MHDSPVEDAAFGIDTACKAERMRLKDGAVGQLISLSLAFFSFSSQKLQGSTLKGSLYPAISCPPNALQSCQASRPRSQAQVYLGGHCKVDR